MVARGGKPKPPGEAINPNRRGSLEWTEVEDVPFEDGPRLPQKAPDGKAWHPWAVRKWRNWRRMPHCVLWTETDWDYALDSVTLAHRMYNDGGITVAAELRIREANMGTTLDARRDLRIRYVEPKAPKPKLQVVGDDFSAL